jgi:sulfur carrier protein
MVQNEFGKSSGQLTTLLLPYILFAFAASGGIGIAAQITRNNPERKLMMAHQHHARRPRITISSTSGPYRGRDGDKKSTLVTVGVVAGCRLDADLLLPRQSPQEVDTGEIRRVLTPWPARLGRSPAAASRNALYKGLFGGSRGWLAIGSRHGPRLMAGARTDREGHRHRGAETGPGPVPRGNTAGGACSTSRCSTRYMRVLLRNPKREIEVSGPRRVHALLTKLQLSRESPVVICNGTLVPGDAQRVRIAE